MFVTATTIGKEFESTSGFESAKGSLKDKQNPKLAYLNLLTLAREVFSCSNFFYLFYFEGKLAADVGKFENVPKFVLSLFVPNNNAEQF